MIHFKFRNRPPLDRRPAWKTLFLAGCAATFLFLFFSRPANANPRQNPHQLYEEYNEQYLKLRNTDVEVVRAGEWESLAKRFSAFVDRYPRDKNAPSAIMKAASLYEQLYRKFGGKDRIMMTVELLESVAKLYPGDRLADDALVKRGDLLVSELNRRDQARRSYQEVVKAYPASDMLEVARIRLRNLDADEENSDGEGTYYPNEAEETEKPQHGRRWLIVIDPGHGGEDYGAVGVGGIMEKDIVLGIALELEERLQNELDAVVRLTRRRDVFVPLSDRTSLANDYEADLFISLHVNASPNGKVSGLETFYLDNSGDAASHKLAERENRSLRFEGGEIGDLGFMLSDLIQSAKLDDSIVFANVVHKRLLEYLQPRWKGVNDLKVRKAPFFVLVGAHMPCVLVELFFVDNESDGQRLASRKFRSDIASGLTEGIREYLQRLPEAGS